MSYHAALLHTGSNFGNRIAWLQKANALIGQNIGQIKQRSKYYQTAAWGKTDQPDFINQAIIIHTDKTPDVVLKQIHIIEKKLDRQRIEKWGQRTVDIDLIFYEQKIIQTPTLTVPHELMHQRNFVLVPSCEIAADWQHPIFHMTVAELLKESADHLHVIPFDEQI